MLRVEMAARSEVGARRQNEDDLRAGACGACRYAVLSDGAGGHRGGALASDLAVRMTALELQSATRLTPESLTRLVQDTHAALGEQQGAQAQDRMHATLVVLWLDTEQREALWTHVGDSRLYLLRQGRVCHTSRDDSVVQGLVDAGHITAQQALTHPGRSQLISALGVTGAIHPHTLARPLPLVDGDAFLICSDGWWDHFDNAALEATLAAADSPAQWLDLMAAEIQAAARPRQDNFSAVAAWLDDPALTTLVSAA